MMTCFLLIAFLKMTYFIVFSNLWCHKNKYDGMFFINCVLENDILCMFYNIVFIYPPIKIA